MEIDNISFTIRYTASGEVLKIEPASIESCMHPGEFTVKPLLYIENDEYISLENGINHIKIYKSDLEVSRVIIEREGYAPKIYRRKGVCTTCTNCGQCSY